MSLHQEVREAYKQVLSGDMSLEEAGQWAFEMLRVNPELEDETVNDALFTLVSFHPIGKMYEPWLPDRQDIDQVYSQLTGVSEIGFNGITENQLT